MCFDCRMIHVCLSVSLVCLILVVVVSPLLETLDIVALLFAGPYEVVDLVVGLSVPSSMLPSSATSGNAEEAAKRPPSAYTEGESIDSTVPT